MSNTSSAAAAKTVAIYCRVSTDEQAASGLGLEAQEARCRAFVVAAGLEGTVRVFVDAGISGSTTDRPALTELRAAVARKEVAAVVVAKIDRLTRRLADLLELTEAFAAKGVAFLSASEQVNTSTAAGRMMLSLLGTFAEFERDTICERTKSAVAAKRARGVGHGFERLGERHGADGRIETVEEETAAVEMMVRRRSEGASLRAIAAELTAAGYPTKRGGAWRACTVDVVLRRAAH
jgi:site-specific DNA recombinase